MAEPAAMPLTPERTVPRTLPDSRLSLGAGTLEDLFPEGPEFRRSLVTYAVLLTLAGIVATFGLYQDSVASIIGAMVIAPLGGAILAISGALVTGRIRWQTISLVQVFVSAVWVIGIAWALSLLMPDILKLTPSLEARTQPGLLDLGVALAAGAAGAFVAARRTGSDALPGVAIAVSLVPPLATVGVCLKLGRFEDAAGAFILFTTNVTAIIVVGAIVFILTGAVAGREFAAERRRLRNGLIVSVIALILISIPLAINGVIQVIANVTAVQGAPVVKAWIGDRDLQVVAYSIDLNQVTLEIAGSSPPTDVGALRDELSEALGHPVNLTVEFTERIRLTAGD